MTTMLLEWVLTSVFLILTVLTLRALFGKRVSARMRYALWAVVLVRLLVPVQLFTSPIAGTWVVTEKRTEQAVYTPAAPSLNQGEQEAVLSLGGQAGPSVTLNNFPQAPAAPALPAAPEPPAAPDLTKAPVWLGWVWLAGSAAVLLVLLLSNLRFYGRLRRVRAPLDETGLPLRVYVAVGLPSPCLFGIFRPAVYVTPEAAADPAMLRHVLAHEYTHYRQGDHLWSLLRCGALAAHWWNPLVWVSARLSQRDGELACDEGALKRLGDGERAAYGNTLLSLVTAKPGPGDLFRCATTMAGDKKSLKERISRIACAPKRILWAAVAVVLVTVLACACAFGQAAEEPDEPDEADNLWPYDISEVGYVRSDGFGGEFTILLNRDGSFSYCEGMLSSYIGMGSWTRDGDVICLADEGLGASAGIRYYYFQQEGSALVFLAERSAQFMYVDVADGDRFFRKFTVSERQADLDHDGVMETVLCSPILGEDGVSEMGQKVEVWEDGELVWSDEGRNSHAGYNAVFLCTLDGEEYLLRYNPYMGQGWCDYAYQLFTLSEDGQEQVAEGRAVGFDINFGPMHGDFDPELINTFMEEINGLLEHSVQLINTDMDLLGTFEDEGRLYDSLWWLDTWKPVFVRDESKSLLENLRDFRAAMEEQAYQETPTVLPIDELGTDIQLSYQDKSTRFEGEWDYNFQFPEHVNPQVVDLNGDGRDEIVVILISGHGTGVNVQTPYVFDAETLEQYDTSTLTQDLIAQIESTGDNDNFYLSGPGMERVIIPKSTFSESPRVADAIELGNIVYYFLIEGQLQCSLGCDASGMALTYCGYLYLSLDFDGEGFRVASCEYEPNYEYIPGREAFRQVLLGEKGFTLYKNEPPIMLNDAYKLFEGYDECEYVECWEFTMLDMDGNGYYEVLLEVNGKGAVHLGWLLLDNWGDGDIHGTIFDARHPVSLEFLGLKTDGTFECTAPSGSDAWSSVSCLRPTAGGSWSLYNLGVNKKDPDFDDSFSVNLGDGSYEEYEAALAAQDAKQKIWWTSFGPENIREVFGG